MQIISSSFTAQRPSHNEDVTTGELVYVKNSSSHRCLLRQVRLFSFTYEETEVQREEVNSHGCRAVSAQWGFCTRPAGIRAHALVLSKKHSPTPGWPVRSLATETACAAHGKEEDPDSALGQPVGRSGTGNVCNGPGSYGAFPEFQRINWTIEVRKSRKQRKIVKQDKIKIL